MSTPQTRTLTVEVQEQNLAILERVARMRLRIFDPQAPIDWGQYLSYLFSQDVAACLREIHQRRRV